MRGDVRNRYFRWMCSLVEDHNHTFEDYSFLLEFLNRVDFQYILERDANRYEDGISLRYRFENIEGLSQPEVAQIDDHPCSVLEMIVALCFRCEETIMSNSRYGDRTSRWFWDAMDSLGLSYMTNADFNESRVLDIMHRFLYREYAANGAGGLVTLKNPPGDVRKMEIWMQMMNHLNELEE